MIDTACVYLPDRILTKLTSLHIQVIMLSETMRIERECMGGCVRKLNRMVTTIYDSAFAGAGLKTTQFGMLVVIANRGKARPAELTKLLQLDESTLSRNVERMRAKGWLRLKSDGDRRSHAIELTEKGEALLRKCLPMWRRVQDDVAKRLGTESVAALRSAVRRLPA
jgi:DNA-binding MarR family transcriptional regulator